MPEADVDLRLKGLDGLLVGEGQRLLDELSHRAVCMRARCVYPREETLQEGTLARRDLYQPAPEVELGAPEGVRASVGAHEDEATDELGVPEGYLLGDGASHRIAHDVGARDLQSAQQRGGVVGHRGRREVSLGQRRTSHT